jgi:uncharacterized membrane protein
MVDTPVQVVIAAFANEQGAEDALQDLEEAQGHGLITIRDVAIVQRDAEGTVHIESTEHHAIGRGALLGGVAGAIVGLLTGPVGWATGGGAVIGALASRLLDSGFPKHRVQTVADALRPGTSALVAVIDQTWLKEVGDLLTNRAGELLTETIQADIANELEAGRDVAYTALRIADRTATERIATEDKTSVH